MLSTNSNQSTQLYIIPPDQILMNMMNKDVVQTALMQGDVRLCCSHTKKAVSDDMAHMNEPLCNNIHHFT